MAEPNKAAAALLLVLLTLSVPLASAAGHNFGMPNPGDPGGFAGMPWFGAGAGAQPGPGGGGPGPGGNGFFGGWGEGGLGYRRGAVVPPSTVCAEPGPCHGKRLTCPAHCFRSFSYKGKNGGGGGGGGGCSFDCSSRCAATC